MQVDSADTANRRHSLALITRPVTSTPYADAMLFWECVKGRYYAGQFGGSCRDAFSQLPVVGYEQLMPHADRDQKPSIAWDELRASTTERPIHPNIHESIIQAIESRNFVTLVLHGHEIAGEPHLYAVRGGHPMLLLFNAESDEQWQMVTSPT